MNSLSGAQKIAASLVPTITSSGANHQLGTAFLYQGNSRIYLIASEHHTTQGKSYHCVLPDGQLTASNAIVPNDWVPLRVNYEVITRHQIVLSFHNETDEMCILGQRTPLQKTDILPASSGVLGDDVATMGFWARNPDVPAALRKGHIATEGTGDLLADLKIVHGNSGAPVWRLRDGMILGTAQKNLFDTINLSSSIAGVSELEVYSDLIVTTSLDIVVNWIANQP